MPLTQLSPVYASVHEDGLNFLVRWIMRQRPSLFHYASEDLRALFDEGLLEPCAPLPEGLPRGTVRFGDIPGLPIPGTDKTIGLVLQVPDLTFDFHPGNSIDNLPPEMNPPLGAQQAAMRVRVCVGIACPGEGRRFTIHNKRGLPSLNCFCLEAFGSVRFVRLIEKEEEFLGVQLVNFEIVDLRPEGLEQGLECWVKTVLQESVFKDLKLKTSFQTLDLPFEAGQMTPSICPVSATIPHNPAVEDDQVKTYICVRFN